MASIKSKFSVIGISETWLADSDHNFDIDSYNVIHKQRPSRPGGGVGMYLDADLEFKFRNNLGFEKTFGDVLDQIVDLIYLRNSILPKGFYPWLFYFYTSVYGIRLA